MSQSRSGFPVPKVSSPKAVKKASKSSFVVKERTKFDPRKFSDFLEERSDRPLLELLRSIDRRAALEVCGFVRAYLQPDLSKQTMAARKKRGDEIKKNLLKGIGGHDTTVRAYEEHQVIRLDSATPLAEARALENSRAEIDRLSVQLQGAKGIFKTQRFGRKGKNHLYLFLLQEFVSQWTLQELKVEHTLQPAQIATLVECGLFALGCPIDEADVDAENISKAILNLRRHEDNRYICERARIIVQARIPQLQQEPFLLGTKI